MNQLREEIPGCLRIATDYAYGGYMIGQKLCEVLPFESQIALVAHNQDLFFSATRIAGVYDALADCPSRRLQVVAHAQHDNDYEDTYYFFQQVFRFYPKVAAVVAEDTSAMNATIYAATNVRGSLGAQSVSFSTFATGLVNYQTRSGRQLAEYRRKGYVKYLSDNRMTIELGITVKSMVASELEDYTGLRSIGKINPEVLWSPLTVSSSLESDLRSALMSPAIYDATMPSPSCIAPAVAYGPGGTDTHGAAPASLEQPLCISVQLIAAAIWGVEDNSYVLRGKLIQSWTDPRLAWDKELWQGKTHLSIEDASQVWHPDTGMPFFIESDYTRKIAITSSAGAIEETVTVRHTARAPSL